MLQPSSEPLRSRGQRSRSLSKVVTETIDLQVESCKERLEAASQYRIRQLTLSGQEKSSGEVLCTSYFGTGNHLAYVRNWIYEESAITESPRTGTMLEARRWARQTDSTVDLMVADLPSPYDWLLPRRRFLRCPAWLNQRLPLGANWDDVRGGFRKSVNHTVLRRIRKFQLDSRFTREPEAVADFYHHMYVPYLQGRFRDAAFLEPIEKIQWCVDRGMLLQVVRDGQVVGGAVLYGWGRTLEFLWVGLRNDLVDQASKGVFGALYYYGILRAFEDGYEEVDLSGTRALLNDGVYRFKRQWGARVCDGWCLDTLLIRPGSFGTATQSFLERSPLIVRSSSGLVGKMVFAGAAPKPADIKKIDGLYSSTGIDSLSLVSLPAVGEETLAAARQSPTKIGILDSSHEADPLRQWIRN